MLATGLDILCILAKAESPLTATAIAERVDLHVSNVSRTLRVLIRNGYVRKPTYHNFAPDVGVLALAGSAAHALPVIQLTRHIIQAAAKRSGLQASLAALHQDQVLYLHQCQPDGTTVTGIVGGFPLHCSVVGLRLLLDLPKETAISALERASRQFGWHRPTPTTPSDPRSCMDAARQRMIAGILRTDHWDMPGDFAVAMGANPSGHPPLAVALDGTPHCQNNFHEILSETAIEIASVLQEKPPNASQ